MSRHVAIVTDSTAYLPRPAMTRHGITSVPLTVVLGDEALEDGTEISARSLALALQKRRPVTTSRPSPEEFVRAYQAAAEAGATGIVSLHLSAEFSGTYDAAVVAAKTAPVPVRVVDTGMVAMALGFCALAAAETAEAGGSVDEAVAAAEKRAADMSAYFYVDTLDYLRRGGRIGAAQALLGSALAVKPLLTLEGGRIEMLEKVRTASKAIARLEELAVERAGAGGVDVAVHHLAAPERAEKLAERLRERIPGLVELHVSEVGAVIGAHTGPGLLAAVVSPADHRKEWRGYPQRPGYPPELINPNCGRDSSLPSWHDSSYTHFALLRSHRRPRPPPLFRRAVAPPQGPRPPAPPRARRGAPPGRSPARRQRPAADPVTGAPDSVPVTGGGAGSGGGDPVRGRSAGEVPLAGGTALRLAVRERLPLWLQARCAVEPRSVAAGAVVLVAAVAFGAQQYWTSRPQPVTAPSVVTPASAAPPSPPVASGGAGTRIVVDISGKVRDPGVRRLPTGSRVEDALAAAGGVRPGTDTTGLNRARVLVDGEQVAVGAPAQPAPGGPGPGGGAGPLSLGTATVEQLDGLPGVGPVLAQHIVEFRAARGGFRSVEELRQVDGIGERRFADLRKLVRP